MVDDEGTGDTEIVTVLVTSDVAVIKIDPVCDAEGELEIDKLKRVVIVAAFDDENTGDTVDDGEARFVSVIKGVADSESCEVRD